MTVNHDAVAALPIPGNASKTLLRNVAVARMPYVLGDSEDSRNIVLTDPSTGAITVDLMLLGRVFHYDPTDTTTAHDGTSCLVSSDGLRYKLAVGTDVFAYAVLDNTHSAPPVSPTIGDAYLVAAAATGAWAGKSNYIAVYTRRGWEFVNFSIGRFIYVEAIDSYYHKNAGGSWVTGFGAQVAGANTIPLSAAINFGKRLLVENQTTTAPPGSPALGTAYIIGPSATGGWAGLDGHIAICEVTGSFTVYTPTNGWSAYDKALSQSFTFNGTSWKSSQGGVLTVQTQFTAASAATAGGGTSSLYGFSATSAPSTESHDDDPGTLTYTAAAAGAQLTFVYQCAAVLATAADSYTVALARDSVSAAIDWMVKPLVLGGDLVSLVFSTTAPDASAHTYKVRFYRVSNLTHSVSAVSRRFFQVTEYPS